MSTEVNFLLRKAVLLMVGKIPEGGKYLSPLVGYFWKNPEEADETQRWAEMRAYTDYLCKDLIEKSRLKSLEQKLAGLTNVFKLYSQTSYDSSEKGIHLTTLIDLFEEQEPFFLDKKDPQKAMTYFVAMGSMYLAVLRDQYENFETIFGKADPDKAQHLDELKVKIETYCDAAKAASEKAKKWRNDLIKRTTHTTEKFGILGNIATTHWEVKDHFDGWEQKESWCEEAGSGNANGEEQIKLAEKLRKHEKATNFGSHIDMLFSPSCLWKYFDPTFNEKPNSHLLIFKSGPFAGVNGKEFKDDWKGKSITEIHLRGGSRVDAIQLSYDHKKAHFHGGHSGSPASHHLSEDEYVYKVHGNSGDTMNQITFYTNKHNSIGVGKGGAISWTSEPTKEMKARLIGIEGKESSVALEGITLVWGYTAYS